MISLAVLVLLREHRFGLAQPGSLCWLFIGVRVLVQCQYPSIWQEHPQKAEQE